MSGVGERGPTFPNVDPASTSDDDRRSVVGEGKSESGSDDRLLDSGKRFRELAGCQHSDEATVEGREEPVWPFPGRDQPARLGVSASSRPDQIRSGEGRAEAQTLGTDIDENGSRPKPGYAMPNRPANLSTRGEGHVPATWGQASQERETARPGDRGPSERPIESPPLRTDIRYAATESAAAADGLAVPRKAPIDESVRAPVGKGRAPVGDAAHQPGTPGPAQRQPVRSEASHGAHPDPSAPDELPQRQTSTMRTDVGRAARASVPAFDAPPPRVTGPAREDIPVQASDRRVAGGEVQLSAEENPSMSTDRPSAPASSDLGSRELSTVPDTPMRPVSRPEQELHLSAGERDVAGDPPATQQPPGSDGPAGRNPASPLREGRPSPSGPPSDTGLRPPIQSGTGVRPPDAPLAQSQPSSVPGAHDIERADHPRVHPETVPSALPLTGDRVLQGLHAVPDQPTTAAAQAEGPDTHLSEIVEKLVDRILVSEPKSGQPEVRIMLNTATLEGTEITLSRDANGLSVRFQTPSPEVAQRLNEAQNALQQTLEHNKAEPVRIEIEARREGGAQDPGDGRSRNRRDLREEQKNRE